MGAVGQRESVIKQFLVSIEIDFNDKASALSKLLKGSCEDEPFTCANGGCCLAWFVAEQPRHHVGRRLQIKLCAPRPSGRCFLLTKRVTQMWLPLILEDTAITECTCLSELQSTGGLCGGANGMNWHTLESLVFLDLPQTVCSEFDHDACQVPK